MADEVKVEEPKEEPWYKKVLAWFTKPEVLNASSAVVVAVIGLISAIASVAVAKSLSNRGKK